MVEIRVEGPGKNALGTALIQDVLAQIDSAAGAPVLFTGAGDAFSAGLNLHEVSSLDADGMTDFLGRLEDFFKAVFNYPGPTAAAVNGHAIAGGCILAMCCDYRVGTVDPRARVGLNEVALGLRFPPALLNLCKHTLSPTMLSQALLGAGLHSTEEAVRLGMLDTLAEDPIAACQDWLNAVSKHPADAYAATKSDLRDGVFDVSEKEQKAFQDAIVPFWTSEALKNKIRAVLGR